MKLGIGTVQFGVDYGISNQSGQTPPSEVKKILKLASEHQICYLDTAASYGESESALGNAFPPSHSFRVITKTPTFSSISKIEAKHAEAIQESIETSLERLKCNSVYGILVHHFDDVMKPGGMRLIDRLKQLQCEGFVEKIGISVYSAEQIDLILQDFEIDLIQIPISVLDQRIVGSGHLKKLKARNIEIHARSVFLQGLLLMPIDLVPAYFKPIRSNLERYHTFLNEHNFSPIEAALGFVSNLEEVDVVLCGIADSGQLQDLIQTNPVPKEIDWADFGSSDPYMVNPALWRT
jgi:aryl-alcohol dehydrogenase-like predicted oxidoreductase